MNEYTQVDVDGTWKVREEDNGIVIRHLLEPSQAYIDREREQPTPPEPEPRNYPAEIDDLSARVEVLEAKITSA